MRITIDVVDCGCSYRRRKIALRSENVLLDKKFKKDNYSILDFEQVSDWMEEFGSRFKDTDYYIIFLHFSNSQINKDMLVKEFKKHLDQSSSIKKGLLVIYTGSTQDLQHAIAGSEDQSWWMWYSSVFAVRDIQSQPQISMDFISSALPVDRLIGDILNDVKIERQQEKKSESDIFDAGARHSIVNAVCPFLEYLNHTMDRNSIDIKEFKKLLNYLELRIKAHLHGLPKWVQSKIEKMIRLDWDENLAEMKNKQLLEELVADLVQIESYARALGRGEGSSEYLEDAINKEWQGLTPKVLWIDDEPAWYMALNPIFTSCGLEIVYLDDPSDILKNPSTIADYDAILLDVILIDYGAAIDKKLNACSVDREEPIADSSAGIGLVMLFKSIPNCPPIYMLSARENTKIIQACTHLGVHGYFVKGHIDYPTFLMGIQRDILHRHEQKEKIVRPQNPKIIMSDSQDPLAGVISRIDHIANSGTRGPILLLGEPGVGKEEIAKELHYRSDRRSKPFEIINCAGLSESLVDSELFGHVRGAFTDALKDRESPFEEANEGILFLDEIDKLGIPIQNKLLRALENRSFKRVGENKIRYFDVIIILASNIDLVAAVDEGNFSAPLLSRTNMFVLNIPPLRERVQAIPDLSQGICRRISKKLGWKNRKLSNSAIKWLKEKTAAGYFDGKAGNIRGLLYLIEKVIVYNREAVILEYHHFDQEKNSQYRSDKISNQNSFDQAAKIISEYLSGATSTSLKEVEEQFRAALFKEMRKKMSREEFRNLFNWTPENLRQHLRLLREKGLIPPEI